MVDIGTEHHVATLASPAWMYVVVDEELLPDEVFTRKYDKNKIGKLFNEKRPVALARERVKGKRYVKIGLRTTLRGAATGEAKQEKQGNE